MVEVRKTIVPAGLYTDPGPFSAAPEGALVEAQNVVIQREGLLEPRPSLIMTSVTGASQPIMNHGHYIEDVGNFIWYTNGSSWEIIRAETDVITGPSDFTFGQINSQHVKGRLLFTSNEGICEMPQESGDTIAYRAGLPRPSAPPVEVIQLASSWLNTGESTAYRFVLGRKRQDGTLMLSPPSCRVIAKVPSTLTASYVSFAAFGITSYNYYAYDVDSSFDVLQEGDLLYIYRSNKQIDSNEWPDDEMRLRATLTYSGGSFEFFDDVLDDDEWSGPALYTNATQEGILQANTRPAYSRDIDLFNGMTFYGGYMSPQRVAVTLKSTGESALAKNPQEIFGGNPLLAITTTAGSTTISFSSTVLPYLAVGQVLTSNASASVPGAADSNFSANTEIVSINSGALTAVISNAALTTAAALTRKVWDWIQVDDGTGTFRIYGRVGSGVTSVVNEDIFIPYEGAGSTTGVVGGYQDIDYKFNNNTGRIKDILLYADGETPYSNILLTFERASLSSDPFTITSTKPNAFDQYVDSVTGITSSQGGGGSRLAFSKNDIPDAVPLVNYIDIGDLSSDIVRIISAQNTLLIFKEDGLYQISGTDPSNLSVQQLDQMVRPVPSQYAGQWFTKLGSTIFMVSTLGPMAITDSGAASIGGPIMETLVELFGQGFSETESQNFYISCGASSDMPYVLFSYCDTSAEEWNTFVFNINNATWTTWSARRAFVAYWTGQYNRLYVGIGYGLVDALYGYFDSLRQNMYLAQYSSNTTFFGCDIVADNLFSSTPSSLGDGWYQLSETEDVVIPEVGDSIKRSTGADWGIIEELVDADTFKVSIYDGSISTSSAFFYIREGFPVRVMFAPVTLGEVGVEKLYKKLSYAFNQRSLLLRLYAEFESYRLNEDKEQISESIKITNGWTQGLSTAEKDKTLTWVPDFTSLDIPVSVANDWALKFGFSIQQAHAWFSLGAIVLTADIGDAEINRGRS